MDVQWVSVSTVISSHLAKTCSHLPSLDKPLVLATQIFTVFLEEEGLVGLPFMAWINLLRTRAAMHHNLWPVQVCTEIIWRVRRVKNPLEPLDQVSDLTCPHSAVWGLFGWRGSSWLWNWLVNLLEEGLLSK